MNASCAVLDALIAGDGKGGTKTDETGIPSAFASHGWMWSDEKAVRMLYEKIRPIKQLLAGLAAIGPSTPWPIDCDPSIRRPPPLPATIRVRSRARVSFGTTIARCGSSSRAAVSTSARRAWGAAA